MLFGKKGDPGMPGATGATGAPGVTKAEYDARMDAIEVQLAKITSDLESIALDVLDLKGPKK